ncbi:MAG: CBS domain-containing protein [Chloroflexi bacterium]|jgi:CBS domain-containing protein|nr:CBS domain-containing protein [Chloroflexota bacterium]
MQDLVRDWMIDLVVYIDPDSTVLEALSIMRRRYLYSLIVKISDEEKQYGIITSTDICDKIVARQQNPAKTKIRDIMTTPLKSVSPDLTIYECARVMSDYQVHHLPVVDEDGSIIGMISGPDFLVVAEALGHGDGDRQLR